MASRSSRRFAVIFAAVIAILIVTLLVAVGMGWIGYSGPILIPR